MIQPGHTDHAVVFARHPPGSLPACAEAILLIDILALITRGGKDQHSGVAYSIGSQLEFMHAEKSSQGRHGRAKTHIDDSCALRLGCGDCIDGARDIGGVANQEQLGIGACSRRSSPCGRINCQKPAVTVRQTVGSQQQTVSIENQTQDLSKTDRADISSDIACRGIYLYEPVGGWTCLGRSKQLALPVESQSVDWWI